jgi:hypothetical protein
VVIDEGEDMNRINHTPNFLPLKNQKSSLDNNQSVRQSSIRASPNSAIRAWHLMPGWATAFDGISAGAQSGAKHSRATPENST